MKRALFALGALAALVLAGCVPNAVRYYRPSVAGGTTVQRHCVPTPSIVEFELAGNKGSLRIRALADRGKHVNQVSLNFHGRAWSEVHFTSTDFRLRDGAMHLVAGASSVLADTRDGTSPLTTEPYQAPPERPGLSRFDVQIRFSDPLPDTFELLSPPIVIDGRQVDFPPILFQRSTWVGISPFNC